MKQSDTFELSIVVNIFGSNVVNAFIFKNKDVKPKNERLLKFSAALFADKDDINEKTRTTIYLNVTLNGTAGDCCFTAAVSDGYVSLGYLQ